MFEIPIKFDVPSDVEQTKDTTNIIKLIYIFPDLLKFIIGSPNAYTLFEQLDITHVNQRAVMIFSMVLFFKYEILDFTSEPVKKFLTNQVCKFIEKWDEDTCLYFLNKIFNAETPSLEGKMAELDEMYKFFDTFEKDHIVNKF